MEGPSLPPSLRGCPVRHLGEKLESQGFLIPLAFSSWQFGKQATVIMQEDLWGKVCLFNFQKYEFLKVVKNCHRALCQVLTRNPGGLEEDQSVT